MIDVFEDGTARWKGYGAAPGYVARAIASLNAAQDAYEDALNAKSRPKPKGQHSQEWYDAQARFAEHRRRAARRAVSGGRSRSESLRAASGSMQRTGRTYVPPTPKTASRRGGGGGGGSSSGGLSSRDINRIVWAVREGSYAGTSGGMKALMANTMLTPTGRPRR